MAGALLAACAVGAYWPALQGRFIWDDLTLVTSRPLHLGLAGLAEIWTNPSALTGEEHYWPVVYTVFWLQARLWGGFESAFGYHFFNVVLHTTNSLIIWWLLCRIGLSVSGAWLAAALFALHPVHVESVAWVIELKDLLSAFFYLLAAAAFLRFRDSATGQRVAWYSLVLLFFALGMLTKSIVVTLPLALLLVIWWQNGRVDRRDMLAVVPILVLGLGLVLLDMGVASTTGTASFALPWSERLQLIGHSFWFYLGKLMCPTGLTAIYPRWDLRASEPGLYLPTLAAGAAFLVLWLLRERIGRGPFAAFAFYALTLGPLLGIVRFSFMQHSFVADRYQYLASLGPLALAGGGWAVLSARLQKSGGRSLLRAAAGGLLLGLAVATWKQAAVWKSTRTLFEQNLSRNPDAWIAYQLLGQAYAEEQDWDRAIAMFREAVRRRPEDNVNRRNLAVLLLHGGRPHEALACLEEALRREPSDQRTAGLRDQVVAALKAPPKTSMTAEESSSTAALQDNGSSGTLPAGTP